MAKRKRIASARETIEFNNLVRTIEQKREAANQKYLSRFQGYSERELATELRKAELTGVIVRPPRPFKTDVSQFVSRETFVEKRRLYRKWASPDYETRKIAQLRQNYLKAMYRGGHLKQPVYRALRKEVLALSDDEFLDLLNKADTPEFMAWYVESNKENMAQDLAKNIDITTGGNSN